MGYGVYCGPGHPLHAQLDISLEDGVRQPFAAPAGGAPDHWPREINREIGAELTSLQVGIDFCCTGEFLAVLPDPVARRYISQDNLRRLPVEHFTATAMDAVYREPLGSRTKIDTLLPALREIPL